MWAGAQGDSFPAKVIVQNRALLLTPCCSNHPPSIGLTVVLPLAPISQPHSLLTFKLQNIRGRNNVARLFVRRREGRPQAMKVLSAPSSGPLCCPLPGTSSPKHLPFTVWMDPGPLYSPCCPAQAWAGKGDRRGDTAHNQDGGYKDPCFTGQS